MPFQSEQQRKYLWANEPEIAKRWEKYPKGYNTGGVSHLFRSKEPAQGGYIRPEDSGVLGLADGGKIIEGQPHNLAYITPGEAKTLQNLGGKKVMTKEGIPAYPYWDVGQGTTKESYEAGRTGDHRTRDDSNQQDQTQTQTVTETVTTPPKGRNWYGDYDPNNTTNWKEKGLEMDYEGEVTTPVDRGEETAREYYNRVQYLQPLTDIQKDKQTKKIYEKYEKKDTLLQKAKNMGSFLYDAYKTKSGLLWNIGGPIPAMIKFASDQNKKKKALIKDIEKDIKRLKKLGAATHSPHTDTLIQKLEQKILDLTQIRKRKDERDGDGDKTTTTIAKDIIKYPTKEEMMAASRRAYEMLYGDRRRAEVIPEDTSKRDAYLAAYRQKYLMGAKGGRVPQGYNTGGLSNLFRLKNT